MSLRERDQGWRDRFWKLYQRQGFYKQEQQGLNSLSRKRQIAQSRNGKCNDWRTLVKQEQPHD